MNRILFSAIAAILIIYGCAAREEPATMPALTPPDQVDLEPVDNPGSLYSPARAEFLFDDNRAKRVGDIVLVSVAEATKASNKADTDADRESNISLGVEAFPTEGIVGMLATPLGVQHQQNPKVKAGSTSDFKGSGETKQESTFLATVACRIVRMLPGNVMQVEGARQIRINNETQILVVRGLLRKSDVASDNTVSSKNLAEARIEVYGEGVLSDKQRPGWLARILDNIWPF